MTSVITGRVYQLFIYVRKVSVMKEKLYRLTTSYKTLIFVMLAALCIGVVVGAIDALFGRVLLSITSIRDAHPYNFIPFLAIAGVVIVYCYKKFGGNSGKGMNLIFEVGHGIEKTIPLRLIPLIISGTWLTHLFGGSAGREGVAVQIGATFSHWFGRKMPIENASKIFLVTGMAAGFAGLFQTPIAAILFAMEVLMVGVIEYQALLPVMIGAFSASFVSHTLGLEKFSFALTENIDLDFNILWKLIILGIIFGITGAIFAHVLKKMKVKLGEVFKNPIIRIAVVGVFLSCILLLLYAGRYSGLGTNLIQSSFHGGTIYSYDWILKFLLTIITLSAGFQGGEVTPLFAIGASLGVVLAGVLHLPIELVAALGYISVFGSATNTFFAPLFIGGEVFGFAYMPYFFIVCAIAYVCNKNKSIYTLQK